MTTVTVSVARQNFYISVDKVLHQNSSGSKWYLVLGSRWGFVPPALLVQAEDREHAIDRCVEETSYFRRQMSEGVSDPYIDIDPFDYTAYGVPYLAEDIGRVFSVRAVDIHWGDSG